MKAPLIFQVPPFCQQWNAARGSLSLKARGRWKWLVKLDNQLIGRWWCWNSLEGKWHSFCPAKLFPASYSFLPVTRHHDFWIHILVDLENSGTISLGSKDRWCLSSNLWLVKIWCWLALSVSLFQRFRYFLHYLLDEVASPVMTSLCVSE